jgi:phage terminase small subunit
MGKKQTALQQKPRKPRTSASKPSGDTPERLTVAERRQQFVEAYLSNGGNALQAAISAGFSAKTAGQQGHRLLKHVEVAAQIEQRRAALAAKYQLTTEALTKSLSQAIHFDPRKLYRPDGSLKAVTELDDDTAMALAGMEVTETTVGRGEDAAPLITKKVKWLDKNVARDQANRILGEYGKDNAQSKPQTRIIVVPAKDIQ